MRNGPRRVIETLLALRPLPKIKIHHSLWVPGVVTTKPRPSRVSVAAMILQDQHKITTTDQGMEAILGTEREREFLPWMAIRRIEIIRGGTWVKMYDWLDPFLNNQTDEKVGENPVKIAKSYQARSGSKPKLWLAYRNPDAVDPSPEPRPRHLRLVR